MFFATIFFVLLAFAAWTSAIGLMEPAVAWIVEHFNRTRAQATVMVGLLIWAIGFGSVLSFNLLSDVTFLAGTIYDNVDYLTSNIMLPLGGLLIAVFAGWVCVVIRPPTSWAIRVRCSSPGDCWHVGRALGWNSVCS